MVKKLKLYAHDQRDNYKYMSTLGNSTEKAPIQFPYLHPPSWITSNFFQYADVFMEQMLKGMKNETLLAELRAKLSCEEKENFMLAWRWYLRMNNLYSSHADEWYDSIEDLLESERYWYMY